MGGEHTRQRLLRHGARLMHHRGYHPTGIKDILKAAEVPKGSFYFYFESKEAFALEVIDFYILDFSEKAHAALAGHSESPLAGLRTFFESFRSSFDSIGATLGCPIGNMALELGDTSEVFRRKLGKAMVARREAVEAFLREAVRQGQLSRALDTAETAAFILNSWEGALVAMKAAGNTEPLRLLDRVVFDRILAQPL
jgi:TetR/AcrR family transcriptional repressor of nem operon